MNTVTFSSQGEILKGNLYLPPAFDPGRRYPAVIVAGSWLTVKEQMAGLYAAGLAEVGFVTLAFDFRGFGESGGALRQAESPERKSADIRAAVDYLLSLPFVDGERLGGLGVCASTGYMAVAAAADPRLKTLAMVAPWLHNASIVAAIYGGEHGVRQRLAAGEAAQAHYTATGEIEMVPAASSTNPQAAMYAPDPAWLDYYLNDKRGAIPAWDNQFAVMAWPDWLQFDPISIAPEVKAPVFMIHSETAAIPDGARAFYAGLGGPKSMTWTEGDTQLDFYDRGPTVARATQAVAAHFSQTL